MTRQGDVRFAVRRALHDRRRRIIGYGVIALVLALLAVFPQPYIGRARILPRDPTSALGGALGGAGGRIQDLGALLGGNGRAIDLYLAVAQSDDIRNEVIARLHLVGPDAPYATFDKASVHLARTVDVQSLPGSILQIEAKTHDPAMALQLTRAFTDVIASHLRDLDNQQVSVKQALLDVRFREAATRLSRAQAALNVFRRINHISAAPEVELGSAIAIKSGIEARLQAKEVELQTLQGMLGPDNVRLRAAQTEIRGLRAQLDQTTSPTQSAGGPNAGGLTELSTQYLDLYRDYLFAQSIYEVYSRVSEQVAVEDLSGRDAPTVQFIEQPHVDPGIHVNVWATAALIGLALLALFTEVYAPATGIDVWKTVTADRVS
jgi:hypothetical protein